MGSHVGKTVSLNGAGIYFPDVTVLRGNDAHRAIAFVEPKKIGPSRSCPAADRVKTLEGVNTPTYVTHTYIYTYIYIYIMYVM